VKGRLIGVLNVDSNTPGTYNNNMGETVAAFANQAAVAIENAQLYERLREVTEDLTRRVAERTADLQAERDRTLAILESAGQGIILTDLGMEIVYVNSALERQSGYARLLLTERPLQTLLSDEVSDADFSQMRKTVQSGRGWSGEWVVRHQDGHTYDVAITISPFRASDKSINGFVAVLTDITRLKEVERLKTRFVSNVSHELRTPLTNIKMYLTLLERGPAERRQTYLAVLQEETARLAQLIQDLLDLSQLEMDMPSQDVRADAAAVLQNVLASLASRAEAKEVELCQEMEGPLPQATIAPQLLAQVMANLVDNAIAYTPAQGEVRLTGGTAWRRQRPFIWMRVADNGPGILPEELPHLFDRFYRGRQGEERKVPGTGLGLAICKEIVTRYGGYIDVDSAPGEGAAFTVWLPAVEPAPSSLPEAAGGLA
jgi:PAS domain S-box-containing protein